jgi:hypothetical protein
MKWFPHLSLQAHFLALPRKTDCPSGKHFGGSFGYFNINDNYLHTTCCICLPVHTGSKKSFSKSHQEEECYWKCWDLRLQIVHAFTHYQLTILSWDGLLIYIKHFWLKNCGQCSQEWKCPALGKTIFSVPVPGNLKEFPNGAQFLMLFILVQLLFYGELIVTLRSTSKGFASQQKVTFLRADRYSSLLLLIIYTYWVLTEEAVNTHFHRYIYIHSANSFRNNY